MIARKQEFSLQLNQLIDALLLGRSVLVLFCLAAPAALLLKERSYVARRPIRLGRGETSERIILAREADKAHKILQGFSASQRLEIHVVHIVELEHLGTDAIYRHNVGRVILTFGRIGLPLWICSFSSERFPQYGRAPEQKKLIRHTWTEAFAGCATPFSCLLQ